MSFWLRKILIRIWTRCQQVFPRLFSLFRSYTAARYLYSPSELGSSEIRLITLHPGAWADVIHCSLHREFLYKTPSYEALSYVWGDPKLTRPLLVDGCRFDATLNLESALRYLRHHDKPRRLWVDAICINQDDRNELSAQVAIMDQIYRTADRVISWLGVSVKEMEYATLLLQHVRLLKQQPSCQQYAYPDSEEKQDLIDRGLYSLQFLLGERERERPEYWQRAWITQEVALARSWILQSGSYIISDEGFELVADFLKSPSVACIMNGRYDERKLRSYLRLNSFIPVSIYRSLLPLSQANERQQLRKDSGPWTLLVLLRHNRSRFCRDARDKIFSVIGVSDLASSNHPGISIDYKKSISEVFIGAVQAIIQSSSTLEVLCSTNLADTNPVLNLPSWVPNWSAYKSPDAADRPVSYRHQKATGTTCAKVEFRSDAGSQILSVLGFCFGAVLDFKDPFVRIDIEGSDATEDADAAIEIAKYVILYRQLPHAYRELSKMLHPRPLSDKLFRHTCSFGLLHHDIDDGFQDLMDDLELGIPADQTSQKPIKFSGMRYRYRTMFASINSQCAFALKPIALAEFPMMANGMIGAAPKGVLKKNDLACLLLGCSAPIILRPVGNRFRVVCPAYIEALMDGSGMEYLDNGLFNLETFDLE